MVKPGPVSWSYGYDFENRLTGVTSSQGYGAAYTYSADGLRLRVQESNHAYPDRWLQYDGDRPVLEGTLSGDTYTTTAKYVWEGESYYSPLISEYVGSWRHYLYDGLGSTRQLLDASQNVTDTYSYEAFGTSKGATGSTANPYRYVGSLGYYQTGSSLMHLGARYYLPEVGRFTTVDPVLTGASDRSPTGLQYSSERYAYCREVTNCTDPSGCFDIFTWLSFILRGCFIVYIGYRTGWMLNKICEGLQEGATAYVPITFGETYTVWVAVHRNPWEALLPCTYTVVDGPPNTV